MFKTVVFFCWVRRCCETLNFLIMKYNILRSTPPPSPPNLQLPTLNPKGLLNFKCWPHVDQLPLFLTSSALFSSRLRLHFQRHRSPDHPDMVENDEKVRYFDQSRNSYTQVISKLTNPGNSNVKNGFEPDTTTLLS